MPRTIVYDSPEVQRKVGARTGRNGRKVVSPIVHRRDRQQAEADVARDTAPDEGTPAFKKDDFLAKIVKYVPAEVITVVTLAVAAFSPTGSALWWTLVGGAALNVVYLLSVAIATAKDARPRWYFYVVSVVAFGAWSMVMVGAVQKEVGLDGANAATKQTFVLAAATLAIPLIDTILGWLDQTLFANKALKPH
jgi:hypothetical protein